MDRELIIKNWLRLKLSEGKHGIKKQLAEHIGLTPTMLTRLLNVEPGKEYRSISAKEFEGIKEFFDESPFSEPADYIFEIPLLNRVSAGNLTEIDPSEVLDVLKIANLPHKDFFALKVEGRSMDKIAVTGAIIVVDTRSKTLRDKKFYVFQHEGYGTFKRYNSKYNTLEAYSWSKEYEPIELQSDAMPVGEVKRVILDL